MYYFTTKRPLFLVPSQKCCEEFDKIDIFMELLEKSGVGKIIESVKLKNNECKGRKGYDPYKLFVMITYCFAHLHATLRDIERECIFDFRVYYIMEGEIPDHSVIGDFINKYIVPYQYEIFVAITKEIIKELNLDISDTFQDGTKFEANANKYQFVWKPTKYHKKLDNKIKELLIEINHTFKSEELVKSEKFYQLLNDYVLDQKIDINNIPNGRGKRLTKEQKYYKLGIQYLEKLLDYEEKEKICGENRNSYYKTDHDATAMVLKEDYYSKLSNDFHAGYNVQVIVSNYLILMYGVFQDRNDYHTFIPMNELYFKYYGKYPKNICDDSGYGIYSNYKYMQKHNIGNYVKFQAWKGESSGKKPQLFYAFNDGVMCLNACIGEEMPFKSHHKRYAGDKLYKFTGCNSCAYSYKCKTRLKNKNEDYRIVELNPEYEILKEEARKNLLSPKGIEMRINRSIQDEGTFGQIKNNMNYERIRRRGKINVSAEIMLMCLGVNIRRYFHSLDNFKFKNNYWNNSTTLHKETFPSVKPKEKRL